MVVVVPPNKAVQLTLNSRADTPSPIPQTEGARLARPPGSEAFEPTGSESRPLDGTPQRQASSRVVVCRCHWRLGSSCTGLPAAERPDVRRRSRLREEVFEGANRFEGGALGQHSDLCVRLRFWVCKPQSCYFGVHWLPARRSNHREWPKKRLDRHQELGRRMPRKEVLLQFRRYGL